jgi:hypothetical protein
MAGKKRSEKTISSAGTKREPYPAAKEYRQALCPVCGKGAAKNYWDRIGEFDPGKAFGIIQELGRGRGRCFKTIGYFNPEDDTDGCFEAVKHRLLWALENWLRKGWLKSEEILSIIRQ